MRALRGDSFEVGKGELFTLLGPSGCGKTTPADLYLRPAHRIIADFLGTANFIPVQIERSGNRRGDEMRVALPLGSFVARRSEKWQPERRPNYFFGPNTSTCSMKR